MITTLKNIMTSNCFSLVEIDLTDSPLQLSLYKSENKNRQEYFLLADLSALDHEELRRFLEQTCQEIFEGIQRSGKVELHFEKNCTMIICLNTSLEDQELILAIEEDPYNFKKNVIKYSTCEVAELEGCLSSHSVTAITNDTINDILNANGGADFLDFKHKVESENKFYPLITRIIMKLSFLVYSPRKQRLESLTGLIDDAVPVEHRETLNRILAMEWTDEIVIANAESIWEEQA